MNKIIVIFGMIILLIGVWSTLNYNVKQDNHHEEIINQVEGQWTISGNFIEGESLSVDFSPRNDWSLGPYPDIGEISWSKHFMVNITNKVANNYTLFRITLMYPRDMIPPDATAYSQLLRIYAIEVIHHGGIIADTPYHVQGRIENAGEYTVECEIVPSVVMDKYLNGTLWNHPASPPAQLILYRVTTEVTYPYSFLLPAGILIAAAGCIFSLWGASKPSRIKRHSKKRVTQTRKSTS